MARSKVLVLGVGNTLRRDDGIGPEVIGELKRSEKSIQADLQNGGTDGLALLEIIKVYRKAIIIDAVDMGLKVGDIRLFTPEEAKINIKQDTLSTHGFGLAETIKLMEHLGINTELMIIGIQPEDISFGEGLTKKIRATIPTIKEIIEENI